MVCNSTQEEEAEEDEVDCQEEDDHNNSLQGNLFVYTRSHSLEIESIIQCKESQKDLLLKLQKEYNKEIHYPKI